LWRVTTYKQEGDSPIHCLLVMHINGCKEQNIENLKQKIHHGHILAQTTSLLNHYG